MHLNLHAVETYPTYLLRAAIAEPTPILDGITYRYIIYYRGNIYFAYAYSDSRPTVHTFFSFRSLVPRDTRRFGDYCRPSDLYACTLSRANAICKIPEN